MSTPANLPVPSRGVQVVNMTRYGTMEVADAGREGLGALYDAIVQWHRRTQPPRRAGSIVERDRYVMPATYFEKVRVARRALSDDVVGGAADGTEALALNGTSVWCANPDERDVWNQVARNINLDAVFRKMWRGTYTDSAAIPAVWWGRRSYKVRGRTKSGNPKRKTYENLVMPEAVTMLDAAKVVPVQNLQFGQERLAYMADPWEALKWDTLIAQREAGRRNAITALRDPEDAMFLGDDFVTRFIERRYVPDLWERQELIADGVEDVSNLFLLRKDDVFRHTRTRLDYKRFPEVRLESVFGLLDLKTQLRSADRSHLVGAANYIVLITQGSDAHEATQTEIDNLRAQAQILAQMPVVVGPHTLNIQIITPKLEVTLKRDQHDTVDARLFARAWGTFVPTGAADEDPIKLGRVIGRGLESTRRMMRRTFEEKVLYRAYQLNAALMEEPRIDFLPGTIALAFDQALASYVMDLRTMGEASRRTTLATVDLDEEDEAAYLQWEAEEFDDVFPTNLNPHGAQPGEGDNPALTRLARRQGGRQGGGTRNGGGAAPGTNQGGQVAPEQIERRGRRQRTETQPDGDD